MNRRSLFKRLAGLFVAAQAAPMVDTISTSGGGGISPATYRWWRNMDGAVASTVPYDKLRESLRNAIWEFRDGKAIATHCWVEDDVWPGQED